MYQSFVSTAVGPLLPHRRGWAGIVTFQSPGISPALLGQSHGKYLLLATPYTTESLTGVSVPML